MNTKDISSPPSNQVPASGERLTAPQSQLSEPRDNRSSFGASFDPRLQSQQAARPQIGAIGNNQNELVIQSMQRIGGYACPDVALLDSEIGSEFCDRRMSASSWQSDLDADDYDKENQCVYRENIDHADSLYGLGNADNEQGLFLSPAFSEDSMRPTTNNPVSFGIQSY